jgi:PEP-CTERM motif
MKAASFAAAGLVALAASSAEAGTTSTTDFATWATGLGSYVFGDFYGVPTPYGSGEQMFGGYNPLSGYSDLQGVSFSTSNTGGNVNVNAPGFYGVDDWAFSYAVNSTYTGDAPDVVTITLPDAKTAFGLDFTTLFSSTTATFTLSNGYSTSFANTATLGLTNRVKNFDFIGFISTTPFTTITMSVPSGESWVITSFDYDVTNANAAPEPATWALLAVGFAALGYAGLRRRRDAGVAAA